MASYSPRLREAIDRQDSGFASSNPAALPFYKPEKPPAE
jgi:hypothetical protein